MANVARNAPVAQLGDVAKTNPDSGLIFAWPVVNNQLTIPDTLF